jgi:GDP-L-fucose synthase
VADTVGFKGALEFDASRPDGAPRKLLDVSRLARLGWTARIGLKEGLADAYRDFQRGHLREA